MNPVELALLFSLFLFTGFVKGLLGIGLPPILLGTLTFIYEPRYCVALIIIPIVLSNARQAWRGGSVTSIIRKHQWFLPLSSLSIVISTLFSSGISSAVLYMLSGIAMALFALTSLINRLPPLPPGWLVTAQVIAAGASGALGGVSGIWGPPMLIYLLSLRLSPAELVQTIGVFFLVLSFSMAIGLQLSGELTAEIALLAVFLTLPVFIGMWPGERVRAGLGTKRFERWFLVAFLLLGLNLIRRGLV